MGIHNICHYKEVGKKYTDCNLKTMELLDSVLIEVCVLIRSNTVSQQTHNVPTTSLQCSEEHDVAATL